MRTLLILLVCLALAVIGVFNIARNVPPPPFTGEMYLPVEGEARVAIAEAGRNSQAALEAPQSVETQRPAHGYLPPQAVALLDQDKLYDVARLPFTLEVVTTSVLDESVANSSIEIDGESKAVTVGEELVIGGDTWTVTDIRRWAGLWPHPEGRPYCSVAYRVEGGELQRDFFVEGGTWRFFQPEGAIYFIWSGSEEEAKSLTDRPIEELASVRWGISEGDRMLWFDGLQIGTGATLESGEEVTLVAVADGEEAIRVAVNGEEDRLVTVEANSVSEDGRIQFEHPAVRRYVAVIAAVDSGGVLLKARVGAEAPSTTKLRVGESWSSSDGDFLVRVDQVMANALPVPPEDSTAYEVVLTKGDDSVRIRHGERQRVGNGFALFRRTVEPADVEARLVANHVGEEKVTTFGLRPGESFKVLSWVLTMRPVREEMDAFIIEARYDPGIPLPMWIGGALIFFGFAIALFRIAVVVRRRSRTPQL